MRKERDITIKLIQNNKINSRRLAEFFARKYSEEAANSQNKHNIKS